MAENTDKTKASTNEGQVAGYDHEPGLVDLNIAWLKLLIAKKQDLCTIKPDSFYKENLAVLRGKKPNLFQKQQNDPIGLHL